MFLEQFSAKRFRQHVRWLIFGVNLEHLYSTVLHVLSEEMIALIYVLRSWTHLRYIRYLNCSSVVLEHLALDDGLVEVLKHSATLHLIQYLHCW